MTTTVKKVAGAFTDLEVALPSGEVQNATLRPSMLVKDGVSIGGSYSGMAFTLIGVDPDELIAAIERAAGRETRENAAASRSRDRLIAHISELESVIRRRNETIDQLSEQVEELSQRKEGKPYPTSIEDLWDNAVVVDTIPANEPAIVRFDDGDLVIHEMGYPCATPSLEEDELDGALKRRLLFPSSAPEEEDPAIGELIDDLGDFGGLDQEDIAKTLLEAGWKKAA